MAVEPGKPTPAAWPEVAAVMGLIGATAFGGPAAHIAMMQDQTVTRRGWLDAAEFADRMAATNLLPGPNSTEMALYLSYHRAGYAGLVAGGLAFVLPSTLLVAGLAQLYVWYGTLPAATAFLYGVKPVVIAVLAQALITLGRGVLKTNWGWAIATLSAVAVASGVNEVLVLLVAAVGAIAVARAPEDRRWLLLPLGVAAAPAAGAMAPVSLTALFWLFLKTGAILFGSGYVLVSFIRADLVERLGWLTDAQLLDAVAVGQLTPGPLSSTATFVGWLVAGPAGAATATVAMFIPAFVFVAVTAPWVSRLRATPALARALDGLGAASLGLLAAVALQLGRDALIDLPTALLALGSLWGLLVHRWNCAWLVPLAGFVGVALSRWAV